MEVLQIALWAASGWCTELSLAIAPKLGVAKVRRYASLAK